MSIVSNVAVDEGLLVPVIRYTDMKTLSQINVEVKELVLLVKTQNCSPTRWKAIPLQSPTQACSASKNLPALSIRRDACILAVGSITEAIVKDGEIVVAI